MNCPKKFTMIAVSVFTLLTLTCSLGSVTVPLPGAQAPTPPGAGSVTIPLPGVKAPASPVAPTILPAQQFERINLVAASNGGRIVSAADEHPKYPASNLINECIGDFCEWWTKSSPPKFPVVIVFAFANDQIKTINEVVLNPWTSEWRWSWVKDFEIYVSTSSPNLKDMKQVGAFTLERLGIDQSFTFNPVPAKYVALVITSHYGNPEGATLNEFEVYEAPSNGQVVNPGNLVAAANGGHIVTFSSEDSTGDWGSQHLIDSKKDTSEGWSSDADLKSLQYVVFAFEGDKPRLIDRIVLNPYSANYHEDWIKDFELRVSETSPDPKLMQSLGRFRLEQVDQDQQFTFSPVRARYAALVPLTNFGGTEFALNEFEVYEVQSQSSGPNPSSASAASAGTPGGYVPTPWPTETKATQVDVSHKTESIAPVDNIKVTTTIWDIIPSVYHLYGDFFDSMAQVALTNQNTFPVTVRVEATVTNYTDTGVETVTLAPGEETTVQLNPPFTPGVFERLTEAKDASLHLQIDYLKEGEKRLIYEGTKKIKIWSQGDVLLGDPRFHDPWLFHATLVTPSDPSLDRILRNAAPYAPGGYIRSGYGDDVGTLYNTLKAIYNAVADDGVIYVSAGIPFVPPEEQSQGFYLQRIKLPYQVLETHSGMCVETSILFASLYEKIGLDPVLIRKPGHVFLLVPQSENSNMYWAIETTLVGRASFEEAINDGAEEWDEVYPEIKKDANDAYGWFDITPLRDEGILPIPWR